MTTVKLIVKCPSDPEKAVQLDVSPDLTIKGLTELISSRYEGSPDPSHQTLVFAGRVLKDMQLTIRQLVDKHTPFEGPHNIHLVIKKPQEQQPTGTSGVATPTSAVPSLDSGPSTVPPPAAPAAASSSTGSGKAAGPMPFIAREPPASSANPQVNPMPSFYPYMYVNPVYAAAYQAAYAAALAAHANMQGGMMNPPMMGFNPNMSPPMGYFMPMQAQASMSMMGGAPAATSGVAGQQAQHHHSVAAQVIHDGPNGPEIRIQGLPEDLLGPVALALANLRQRRGQIPGAAGAAHQHGHQHGHQQHARPRRGPRGIVLRISARTILQIVVFAVVLYQHFTWNRFLALLFGGLVLYITSTWGPLRRAMAFLHQPLPQRQAVAQENAQDPLVAGQAQEPAGRAAPVAGAPNPPAVRGVLHEILVVVLGFFTSLLPAWNFNPEDAAAVQQALARDEQQDQQQQQQQQQQGDGVGAEAAGADDGRVGGEHVVGEEPPAVVA